MFSTCFRKRAQHVAEPWARSPPLLACQRALPLATAPLLLVCGHGPATARLRPRPRCCSPAATAGSPCAPRRRPRLLAAGTRRAHVMLCTVLAGSTLGPRYMPPVATLVLHPLTLFWLLVRWATACPAVTSA